MPVNEPGFERLRTILDMYVVTDADIAGPLLKRVGQTHREQMRRVFAGESQGELYPWPRLSPAYALWKRRFLGTKGKILVLSGEMKERFTKASRTEYIQRYEKPYIQLGASDPIAAKHFLGVAPLPKRDMITKSKKQLRELVQTIVDWWNKERLPQLQRGEARLLRRQWKP
jgi:phage gpG-like protein